MSKARRGGLAAGTPDRVRGELRRQLLKSYAQDDEFTAALDALWTNCAAQLKLTDDWRTTPPWFWIEAPSTTAVRQAFDSLAAEQTLPSDGLIDAWAASMAPVGQYLDALADVARRFGLDRLGDEGIEAIHGWCWWRQELGKGWTAARFGEDYQQFGPVPEVGEVVIHEHEPVEVGDQRIRVQERDVRTVLRIAGGEDSWDPTLESRRHAFSRLRRRFGKGAEPAIRAELDRMAALAEKAGARAYDTRSNVERDLEWLFWHLRYRESPAGVAKRAGLPATEQAIARVRQAVWRIARSCAVSLHPPWSDWPSGEQDGVPRETRVP